VKTKLEKTIESWVRSGLFQTRVPEVTLSCIVDAFRNLKKNKNTQIVHHDSEYLLYSMLSREWVGDLLPEWYAGFILPLHLKSGPKWASGLQCESPFKNTESPWCTVQVWCPGTADSRQGENWQSLEFTVGQAYLRQTSPDLGSRVKWKGWTQV